MQGSGGGVVCGGGSGATAGGAGFLCAACAPWGFWALVLFVVVLMLLVGVVVVVVVLLGGRQFWLGDRPGLGDRFEVVEHLVRAVCKEGGLAVSHGSNGRGCAGWGAAGRLLGALGLCSGRGLAEEGWGDGRGGGGS